MGGKRQELRALQQWSIAGGVVVVVIYWGNLLLWALLWALTCGSARVGSFRG